MRAQGPFTEAQPDFRSNEERAVAPTRELSREELSGDAQAIVRDVERSMPVRRVDSPSAHLESVRDKEAAGLAVEARNRKNTIDIAIDHHGEFTAEDRASSPSVYVHRPDRWSPAMQERFRGIVQYLYEHDGIRFPLDPTMDDIQRKKYENIIDEVCTAVDADDLPIRSAQSDKDVEIAA